MFGGALEAPFRLSLTEAARPLSATIAMLPCGRVHRGRVQDRHGARLAALAGGTTCCASILLAQQAVFEVVEVFYNPQRLHSSLGYVTPAAYEACPASARRPGAAKGKITMLSVVSG